MNNNKISENAKKLLDNVTSNEILKESFREIMPSKENICAPICITIISLIIASIISFSNDTLDMLQQVNRTFSELIVALFGIVFTGYTFFQVLISPRLLKRLIELELDNGDSYLKDSNRYFLYVMNINICVIIMNLIIALILFITPNTYCLFVNMIANEILCTILLLIYLYLNICCVWQIKSFVFNLFQYFNLSASEKVLSILNNSDKEEE